MRVLICAVLAAWRAQAGTLTEDFERPPASRGAFARWHWCDGNVSKVGITRDLEAMKRAGLAGATVFHGRFGPRNQLQESFDYHSESWWEHLAFASREAQRLGLQLGMQNCPGYSASGGPWKSCWSRSGTGYEVLSAS